MNTSVKQMPGSPSKTSVPGPAKSYIPVTSSPSGISIDEIKKKANDVKYVDLSRNNQDYVGIYKNKNSSFVSGETELFFITLPRLPDHGNA